MLRLEHQLALAAAVIEKKRHSERELANAMHILAMVMHADRDPHSFAIWLNNLVKR